MLFRYFIYGIVFLLFPIISFGQSLHQNFFSNSSDSFKYYFSPYDCQFNNDIPTPYDILRFNIGDKYIEWNEVIEYFKALDLKSNKISIINFGKTHQNRPFFQVVISSEKNIENLDNIRNKHLALKNDTVNLPVIVNLMYSIHGNEASGVNSAILLGYYFLANDSERIKNLLEKTIIVITPGLNPDGINRFANFANTTKSSTGIPDLNSIEFSEYWPSSRTNHYWIDCNRDWLSVQQPEGINGVKMYRFWKAHIVNDVHEQGGDGKGFYFSPGHPLRNHPLINEDNIVLTKELAQNTAKALDNIESTYYSGEGYDDYFLGKGAAYGDIGGSVCVLYEQVASRGFLRPSSIGNLSFPYTIRNQVVANMSTIFYAYNNREKLMNYKIGFYQNMKKDIRDDKTKGVIFSFENRNNLEYIFLNTLNTHEIKINKLKNDYKSYKKDNSYILDYNQENYYYIKTLFDTISQFRDSVFYDISSWTLPMAYNLKYEEVKQINNLVGEELKEISFTEGDVYDFTNNTIAFYFDNNEFYVPYLLNKLNEFGIKVRIATKPFIDLQGRKFDKGSFIIPIQYQTLTKYEIFKELKNLSKNTGINIFSTQTSYTENINLGSPSVKPLQFPKIAILVGKNSGVSDCGEIWHLLDYHYNLAPIRIDASVIEEKQLDKYNVIIIPNRTEKIREDGNLSKWVKEGGTLIITGKSYGITNSAKMTNIATTPLNKDISGVILKCSLEENSPLGWGLYNKEYFIIKTNEIGLKSSNVGIQSSFAKDCFVSGCISKHNKEKLDGSPAIIVINFGKGKIIYFPDDFNFRTYWFGTNKVFMNAIIFNNLL